MNTFDPSEYALKRARKNAASVNKAKVRNAHGAGNVRDTNRQCPKHHVDYVLRPNTRKAPVLLIYDCPELGCLTTLQVPSKR